MFYKKKDAMNGMVHGVFVVVVLVIMRIKKSVNGI